MIPSCANAAGGGVRGDDFREDVFGIPGKEGEVKGSRLATGMRKAVEELAHVNVTVTTQVRLARSASFRRKSRTEHPSHVPIETMETGRMTGDTGSREGSYKKWMSGFKLTHLDEISVQTKPEPVCHRCSIYFGGFCVASAPPPGRDVVDVPFFVSFRCHWSTRQRSGCCM